MSKIKFIISTQRVILKLKLVCFLQDGDSLRVHTAAVRSGPRIGLLVRRGLLRIQVRNPINVTLFYFTILHRFYFRLEDDDHMGPQTTLSHHYGGPMLPKMNK